MELVYRESNHHPMMQAPDQNRWRQRWLEAFDTDEEFLKEYKKLSEKTGITESLVEHKIQVRRIQHEPPLTIEELTNMNNDEIAQKMKSFQTDGHRWEEPSLQGFAELVRTLAINSPEQFTSNLEPFGTDLDVLLVTSTSLLEILYAHQSIASSK